MKESLLAWLCSPCCRAGMDLSEGGWEEGRLSCLGCRRQFAIRQGVPRLAGEASDPRVAKTRRSFAWEWQRYPGSLEEDERIFLEECQLTAADFKGKRVLDAGCGMGRYALVALSLGAEVVALDLSESLLRLSKEARRGPGLHLVQADLLNPPLREGLFDIVYSHGVLHHTADAREAFRKAAALVKPAGLLSVWLYGKAGRFSDFRTNPLKSGRAWVGRHRRLAWLVVALRHFLSDALRAVTTRLPIAVTYALCYPLAFLGSVPGLKYLTFSVHSNFRVRLIENFDWLSPAFQSHHTKEELASWYGESGFIPLKVLPHGLVPKPGILGRKDG